jgi:hypothetical protein
MEAKQFFLIVIYYRSFLVIKRLIAFSMDFVRAGVYIYIYTHNVLKRRARGSVAGSGTMQEGGRSWVRIPMRSLNIFFNSHNSHNSCSHITVLGLTQPLTDVSTIKCSWEAERGRRLRLTTSLPSVSRLYNECEILNILQPYRPSCHVTGMVVLFYIVKRKVLFARGRENPQG